MVATKDESIVSRKIERTFWHLKSIQTRAMFITQFWLYLCPKYVHILCYSLNPIE